MTSCMTLCQIKNHRLVLICCLNNSTRGISIISSQEETIPNLEILRQVGREGRFWLTGTIRSAITEDWESVLKAGRQKNSSRPPFYTKTEHSLPLPIKPGGSTGEQVKSSFQERILAEGFMEPRHQRPYKKSGCPVPFCMQASYKISSHFRILPHKIS